MIDIFCLRCGAKIGWRYRDAQGVVIKCPCGTKNYVSPPEKQAQVGVNSQSEGGGQRPEGSPNAPRSDPQP